MRFILVILLVALIAGPADAQAERYELGQRLKRFEAEWEKYPDADARKRALAVLPDLTAMFFSLRFGEAGHTLDRARWLLAGKDEPPAAQQWLESLYAIPEKRLIDTKVKELTVEVRAFYKVKAEAPKDAVLLLNLDQLKPVAVPLDKLPAKVVIPVPAWGSRDYTLTIEAKLGEQTISKSTQKVSALPDLAEWLKKDRANWPYGKESSVPFDLSKDVCGWELATYRDRLELLAEIADGQVPETDVSVMASRDLGDRADNDVTLIWDMMSLLIPHKRSQWFRPEFAGDHRVTLPIDKKKTQPVRLFVPKGLNAKKPVPLVVALHGMGGSENLFFEGYGAGHIVQECKKRGWLLVAPRSGISFGSGPPVKEIVGQLAERYPIDRGHIFLVGHSMGAAQTVALCQDHPGFFRGAAALGGGGRVKDAKPFAALPFFVGVGEKDFARGGAKALAKVLKDGGAEKLTFKEYSHVEHMLIVRVALPDVFALWDTLVPKK